MRVSDPAHAADQRSREVRETFGRRFRRGQETCAERCGQSVVALNPWGYISELPHGFRTTTDFNLPKSANRSGTIRNSDVADNGRGSRTGRKIRGRKIEEENIPAVNIPAFLL